MQKYSWKTTLGGLIALVTGILMLLKIINKIYLGEPLGADELAVAISAVSAGFVGIKARDNNVSSEEAGIK